MERASIVTSKCFVLSSAAASSLDAFVLISNASSLTLSGDGYVCVLILLEKQAGCVSSVITVERCLREGVALPVVTTWDNNPTQSTDWTNTTRSIIWRPAHDRSQSKFLDFTFIYVHSLVETTAQKLCGYKRQYSCSLSYVFIL